MAPDAEFQPEDITNRVRRITLTSARITFLPDEQGLAHLALSGTGGVTVVAVQGSDVRSGSCIVQIGLRRESRRDEWGVWSFELRPR